MSEKIYLIINSYTNKVLTASRTGYHFKYEPSVIPANNSGTDDQMWVIDNSSFNSAKIRSKHSYGYGLTVHSTESCTIRRLDVKSPPTYRTFKFVSTGEDDVYTISPTSSSTLKLTIKIVSGNYSLYWTADNLPNYQKWELIELGNYSPSLQSEVDVTVNLNQKYIGNPQYIIDEGCTCCCQADTASFFDLSRNYSIQDMINCGAYDEHDGAEWGSTPAVDLGGNTKIYGYTGSGTPYQNSSYFEKIRNELDSGVPVIVCFGKINSAGTGFEGNYHYVVAYKYINGGDSLTKIYVKDPRNKQNTSSTKGKDWTLSEAMNACLYDRIHHIMYTSLK